MKRKIKGLLNIFLVSVFLLNFLPVKSNEILNIGNENAKITVKVFSSLTCPHCASFHNKVFNNLKKEYIDTQKIKFEHHSFPLDLAALNAEKVLRSVENKEKSFQFLSVIYEKQSQWAVGSDINTINESIKKIGLEFGLNAKLIDKFLKNDKIQDQILNERINAQKNYNITSTPTIYINEKKYEGDHEFKSFKKALDKKL
jgi:protein-disulfide isomerase|tara:strand:- start:359 stop:958 length:600 start_codon:yes stop_codon:yes gene_type:complete